MCIRDRTCGAPLKPILLTEDEAVHKAEEIRNDLVEGAEIISSFGSLESLSDYERLYKQLEHLSGINTVWRMKYYHLLFPTLLDVYKRQRSPSLVIRRRPSESLSSLPA